MQEHFGLGYWQATLRHTEPCLVGVSDATLAVQPSQRLNTISQAAVMSLFDPFVGGVLHGFDSLSLAALNGLEARLE